MGTSNGCGLTGIFGGCHDQGKTNAANIAELADYTEAIGDFVTQLHTSNDESFFMISKELAALNSIQKQMIALQNKNWEVIEEQFEIFRSNFHVLQDCNQMLFSNQQLNFNYDTVASMLSVIYSDVKRYRSALYSFRLNVINSIPSILKNHLPMSLVPRESLLAILESVAREQSTAKDRLFLSIPMEDLISYYDSELLQDVVSMDMGLLMTLSVPLASRQTSITVYEAKIFPMPQPEVDQALRWVIEAPYLGISEDTVETALLSQKQLEKCIGSSRYRICHEAIPTDLQHSSCLATLFFGTSIDARSVCASETIFLPTLEQAENLGYGIWLITSSSASFSFRETY